MLESFKGRYLPYKNALLRLGASHLYLAVLGSLILQLRLSFQVSSDLPLTQLMLVMGQTSASYTDRCDHFDILALSHINLA